MKLKEFIELHPPKNRVAVIEDLAGKVGLSPATISSMRCGERNITPITAVLLEKASSGVMTREELCPSVFN